MVENKNAEDTRVEEDEASLSEEAEKPEEESNTLEGTGDMAAAGGDAPDGGEGEIKKAAFTDLVPAPGENLKNNLDLLMGVTVPLTVELGRSTMKIEDFLQLSPGSVIELDKDAADPVDLTVNGKLIARGEIVVVDDSFGIRVNEILDPGEIET